MLEGVYFILSLAVLRAIVYIFSSENGEFFSDKV